MRSGARQGTETKGKRIIPKHDGVWNQKKEYEELTIVLDAESGDGYISRKPVPAGTVLTDTDYWSLCSHFNAQMHCLETNVAEDVEGMHRNLSETESVMRKELSEAESRVNTKVSDAQNAMQKTEDAMNTAVEQMNKRLDANVTASTDSKADYAAELVDVRVGQDGTVYPSAGEGMDQQRVDSAYTPAAGSAEAMYNELLKDILKRKEELENELHILEESSEGGIIMKKRYEYFLEELLALPEQNRYGQKLVVRGLDDKEPQWTESGVFLSTPDMLTFSREMYAVNIESGRVDGDSIHYRTIYGMEFTAFGARRTIKDFKDYRVYDKDGKPKFAENEAEILGEPVQVEYRKRRNGKKI